MFSVSQAETVLNDEIFVDSVDPPAGYGNLLQDTL